MTKKILYLFIIIGIVSNPVFASTLSIPEDRGILLYEEKSGEILYEQHSTQRIYPASTTKIMTALLVLENLELDDKITVGEEITAISSDSSKADLIQGEVLTVKDLLYGLLVVSGNDAAYTLAKNVGSKIHGSTDTSSSVQAFVDEMNAKAKKLGATDTHFMNPHGLHNENHYTTTEDMLVLTKELLKYEEARKIVSTTEYSVNTNKTTHEWSNTNVFLHKTWDEIPNQWLTGENPYYLSYVKGVKTGFTNAAGRCVVFTAQREGMNLVGLLYHSTKEDIWQEGIELMDFAAENYTFSPLMKEDGEVDNRRVENPSDTSPQNLTVVTKEGKSLLIKNEEREALIHSKTINYDEKYIKVNEDQSVKLVRDIKSGQKIGTIAYVQEGKVITEGDVYSRDAMDRRGILDFLFHWQIILLFVVLLLLFVRRKRRRKKRYRYKNKTRKRLQ